MIDGDCILWRGGRSGDGRYGRAYEPSSGYGAKDRRELLAHRQAWERAHGPIPAGMHVHHRCEVKLCVNVDHLELLTMSDHFGAGGHGKLTQETADEIRWLREQGWLGIDIAAAYGCSPQQVCHIFKGRSWA